MRLRNKHTSALYIRYDNRPIGEFEIEPPVSEEDMAIIRHFESLGMLEVLDGGGTKPESVTEEPEAVTEDPVTVEEIEVAMEEEFPEMALGAEEADSTEETVSTEEVPKKKTSRKSKKD